MTENTNTFAARLRELSRLASAGPWEHVRLDLQVGDFAAYVASCVETGPLDEIHAVLCKKPDGAADVAHTGNGPMSPENAAAIVFLRNHADRLADLVERVEAYREATDVRETFAAEGPHDDTMTLARLCTAEANAYRAMLAALDALGGAE